MVNLIGALTFAGAALDTFIGELNAFGHTETQIAFSTPKPATGVGIEEIELKKQEK